MLQKRGSHTVIDKTNYYGVWIGMETEADSVRSLLKICRQGGLKVQRRNLAPPKKDIVLTLKT